MDCHRLKGVNSFASSRRLRVSYFSTDYFVRGRGNVHFLQQPYFVYMFISCGEYAKRYTPHWAENRTGSEQCGRRCGALKTGEARQKPATGPLSVLRGKSHRSYLPDEQGHCDTVFEDKDIFLKSLPVLCIKTFL